MGPVVQPESAQQQASRSAQHDVYACCLMSCIQRKLLLWALRFSPKMRSSLPAGAISAPHVGADSSCIAQAALQHCHPSVVSPEDPAGATTIGETYLDK